MKKPLPHLLLLCSLMAGNAYATDYQYLESITTSSEVEQFSFEYNEFNKVSEEIHTTIEDPTASTVRKFKYDDRGNCIEELVYQDYYITDDPSQFILVIKVEYTYNDLDQMTRRTAFALDIYVDPLHPENCPLTEQSYLDFTYNANGQLSSVATSFVGGMQIQKEDYLYDADNVLYQIDTYSTFFGAPELQSSIKYSFYDSNILASASSYYMDWDGEMYCNDVTDYLYDDDWNLTDVEVWSGNHNSIVSRDKYIYTDNLSIDSAIYPINFEDTYWKGNLVDYLMVKQPIAEKEVYITNNKTGQLDYLDTYLYHYTSSSTGVKSVTLPNGAKSAILKSIRDGIVELEGMQATENVRLIDMKGQTLYAGKYGNGINVANLGAGTYCIITPGGAVKFAK